MILEATKYDPMKVDGFPVVLGSAETKGAKELRLWDPLNDAYGGQDGPNPVHKCDWKCENEHVCGNMFRCKLTGLTHICDKNCNQRILYDNNSSLCRVSRQVFPLTTAEAQAVKGVRRKLDEESCSPPETCAFKRRRNAQFHSSPFERSFSAVGPICSPIGDGMDTN